MDSLIRLINVSFRYQKGNREIEILRNHQSEIRKNEFVSLVGLSGCGKSTVLKLIAGLYEPTDGRIEFSQVQDAKRLGNIGLMPQQDLLMPWRTVAENAGMALEIQGIPKKEIQQ